MPFGPRERDDMVRYVQLYLTMREEMDSHVQVWMASVSIQSATSW